MLNFLRIFRHKNLLKIAVFAALIGFGNSLWSEKYIWNENAKSDVLRPYTWSSKVDGENSNSIWKKESPHGSWGYLTSTPEMTLSDNILFSGECTVIVQLEKDISVDKIIMAYEQGGPYPVTSGVYPITIDLNGYNLTCNDLILNNNGKFHVNLTITDSNATKGNFIIKNGFDFSDNQPHTINITQGANLKIEGTITGATSGTGSVTIDSSDQTGKLEVTGNVENNGKGFNTNAENLDVTSSIFIWTGAKDTVWEDAANWSTGTVPAETAEVAIPDGLTNYPTIAAGKIIVVKSLAMGDSAEITVEGTLSVDSDFTINNRITGSGSLVVPAGKTYTVPAITVRVGIVNNGTVDCGTNKVVFAKDLANGSSGKFYVASEPGTTTFKGNTDFSAGTLGISGSEPGTINFYNPITSETDPVKTLKTPSTQLSINNFNFGGKINIELGAKITTKQLNMDALGVTENFSSKDFIVNISGGEIECTSMNITRASATNDVIGTLNLSTNVKCTGTIQTHSGTNLNNTNGYNFEATTFDHSADNSTPYTKLSVNGTFTVTDFVIQSNNGSTEVEISSTGKLIASNINVNNNKTFKKATKADGSEWSGATGYSITNNGTIQVGKSLNLPASFKIKNDGTIKDKDSPTGATYTFAGTYDNSSTGTLIVDGGSVTNTTAAITINNLTLKKSNTINGTQKITVTNATYTDSTNLAIMGTVELPGVTNGNVTIGNVNTEGTTTFTSYYQLNTLTITNGTLTPAASSTNKINTRFTNNGTYTDSTDCTLQLADGATIDGTPASGYNNLPNLTVECLGSATFDCSNIINTLKAEKLEGKTLTFATDTFQTVTKLYLSGSSTTDTLSLTGNGSWKINIDDPNNASVKWVTIKNSTANQSSLKQIFAEESFDNGNNTNWDFAITYKWTGAKNTAWEDAANWTPTNYGYPGSTTTAHNVLIPDGLDAEKYPEYTNITNKIKTLKIGESATLTLNANNLQVDDNDAGTADLSNYGTIIFTNAGRITDSSTTPVPIMDNAKGTVEYSTGTTCNITDYHNGNNGTADYYNLVIKSGRWTIPASATGSNNNIKAANSFTIESGATLVMDDTAEVSTTLINNGTLSIKEDAGAAIWANFTNNGTVLQENSSSLCFTNNCNTVTDNNTWTFGTDAGISFYATSLPITFELGENADSTNSYSFTIADASNQKLTFKGFSPEKLLPISKWTDTGVTSESLSFDFQNVDFLDNGAATGFTFNSNITASSGNLTFSDDTTFVKKTTFATSGTITVETGKAITAQKDFEVTNGTVDLKGSITTTDVALNLNTVQVSNNASLSAKKITITDSIEPKTTADSSLWNLSLTATGSSDDDTISVGSDTGAEISIGTDDKLFKDITLTTTNQNITFGENCKLHAAGTISATGKNVTFNNTIISNALVVNAEEEVSLNGLNAKSFTVTKAAALKFQCDADIGTFSDTADSLKLEIGYIDASDSSNNKAAKVTINKLDGNTLKSKTAVINSELVFAQNSGVTLGSVDSEITIAGSITAAHDITLLGTITSVEVDDASKETLPKITAGSDKAINLGSTTSDQVTYSGPNLYLNSSVNNKAKFINSGKLTANQSFTNNNNAQFINSGTLTANQSFTNNGSATGTSSSAILNLKKDFTDNGTWESEETLVINGTGTQNFTPQSTGSTYNKILIQKTAAPTDHEVVFTAANTLKAKTVTIENNDTTNFNGPVSIETLNDVAASSEAPGSITINGGGTISTATLNTTGDLTVTSDAGLTITNLTHTTGETKVNGKLTLTEDSTVGKITIAKTDGKLQGASGKTITVLGDWTNNGTFTANAGIVTFDGSIIIAGTSNFNTANMAGTISIKSANQYETLNIYNSSSTNNSDPANPVTEITPSRITFPAGPTNVQTVTTALFLKGNSAEKLLKLKSSSSTQITDTTEADCFYINFTGTITDTDESKNPDIQFVEMTNGYNASGEPDVHNYITTYNSVDSGNNYFWNFNGCEYTWTGTKNTDWFTAKNWNRNSVPGKNSIILITEKVNEVSVTQWPDLDKSKYPNGVSKVDMDQGEITIGQKAELHINRKNLAASTITNSGLVKIKGTDAAQTITGTRVNNTGSTVEYYSGTTATPTINFAWGNKYANLLITDVTNNSSDLEISEELIIHNNTALSGKLAVTGTTTIETTENVSLTGSNNLAGGVEIKKVNDAVLNNNGTFNLTQTAGADINTLTINSPVTLKTNVITTSSQTYNDEITLTKATELTVSNSTPADLLTINNKLSGSTYALAIDANTSFTSEEKVTAGYIKSAGTKDRTWTSTTNANLDSDLYIDCDTNKIIFDGNFTANNIYMYNGAVTVKSGKTLEALHNLAVWGAAYSATDKRYSANNTRFEYYTAPAFSFAYTQDSRTTTFDSLAGSTIKVCNNFYLNGTDLPSVTLDLPANTSSKPELNTTAVVTEKQWGLPYAAIFNSAITGVTANTGYVTAAVEQGNTDKGGNNQNLQFEIPQIAQAYTVYDDVIYVEFTLPVENAHNEINTNLGAGATAESNGELSKGGLWYNNKEYRFHPVAYTDKDCTTELEASSEGVTSFYLKTIHTETNTAASYWNTDADGEYAYNQIATNPLESTDRNGIHHNITVDLSMLEGMFTSAKGHTMSSNYGINFEADGSIEAEGFTATQDKCSPVLLAVYTGQENHIPDSDIQPDYDAHNFVEFLYSEPVDIGNETTALKAEDGENNIQASATLGGITGAGVGTGITPATGKGLTLAGLAAFTDGRLNSGNKLDSSSPHSLYRNFSTSVSQSAEKQTNRIRVSIAGYVDGTIDGTHKNWIGYIDYSEMPANGSTVRAIENAYLTDTNGNSIDVKGTQTNHKIATEFKLNQGAKNETLNAIYGSWDTSAPVFSQIRKIRNDYADEYEIVPTGNGSVIDKLEFHILDNEENGNNTYFVFTHGWSQMLDAPDAEGYRYSLKPGFQAADKFGGSRAFANGAARTGGGIRYSSYYNMQSAFKFGIHSDAEPVYNFTAITPGATSSYFTGSSNDAYPIPSTDDNNYISLEISGSSYSYEVQFSISYDNTNAYITDLAGNRLQNALMSSIDRTPPDFDITLAPVGGNTHGNGELYIVFVKKLKLENISVGSYTHEKLVDVLPSIVQFGTINSSFTEDTSLKVESAQVYEPLTVTGTHKGDKEFTAFKLTLNRAVTLDDIKTKYIRIAFPASESEYSLDPFTLAAGARVTYIQDFDGISYLQMYKAHPLSDFAINVINPEYAYDPDYTGDNAASMMRSPDDENGSWAVHDWSKDQKNFGTLPYGGQINLITNTTSDGDSDDSNDAGVPATQSFTLYLSKAPTAESVSTHFNNDFDTKKRIWLPQVAGTPAFEPLSDVLNENFETVLHTAAPDFDEEKYPNRIQFNFNQKDYDWNSGDQIQFLFGLNGTSIMHNPDNTNDGSSYTGISSPIYALRTSNILNPDIQTLDLWSFKLKAVTTQRGGVSIYNNVINVLKGERTTIKVSMPRKGNLKVIVMTLDGNVISYLENSNNVSGDHIYTWNGTNKKGNMVARGLYFIRVIGEGIDETRKVMCINEK